MNEPKLSRSAPEGDLQHLDGGLTKALGSTVWLVALIVSTIAFCVAAMGIVTALAAAAQRRKEAEELAIAGGGRNDQARPAAGWNSRRPSCSTHAVSRGCATPGFRPPQSVKRVHGAQLTHAGRVVTLLSMPSLKLDAGAGAASGNTLRNQGDVAHFNFL